MYDEELYLPRFSIGLGEFKKKSSKSLSLSKSLGEQLPYVLSCLNRWPVKAETWLMSDSAVLLFLIFIQGGHEL